MNLLLIRGCYSYPKLVGYVILSKSLEACLTQLLVCPTCRGSLDTICFQSHEGSLQHGLLRCDVCNTVMPVCYGFPLISETQLDVGNLDYAWLSGRMDDWFALTRYDKFLAEKSRRSMVDSYAAFQPFNESSRSLLAVYDALAEGLVPGDIIVDTWCRTGWQGEWLASLFPQQQIISLWEGNSNVLGYTGFQYWLARGLRLPNLEVVFSHPDRPLPLADNSVALLIGLDSLHRYAQESYLPECLRVTRDNGVLFFPHIHLTNSEPDPFFERGCLQLSGREWQDILVGACNSSGRESFIFSERELFDAAEGFQLINDPDTPHYNGAALIAPEAWSGRTLAAPVCEAPVAEQFLIVNPLLGINLSTAQVNCRAEDMAPVYRELLTRHPCYERRLERELDAALTSMDCEILFHAMAGYQLGEICQKLPAADQAIHQTVKDLARRELLYPAAVSRSMAELQHFYGHLTIPLRRVTSFCQLWTVLGARYRDTPILMDEDGECYDFSSVALLVEASALWLDASYEPGCRVLICSEPCLEFFVVVWACWLSGRVVVPIDHDIAEAALDYIIVETSPAVCLGQHKGFIEFDSLAEEDSRLFSEQVSPYIERSYLPVRAPGANDPAVILFTSGSSGQPKGVPLSQGSLMYTGQLLAQNFCWEAGERLLSMGGLHTMSGIRNTAVAALFPGMTIVLPLPGMMHPQRLLSLLHRNAVSCLSAVPSLLSALASSRELLSAEPRPQELRQIIYTGFALTAKTGQLIEQWLDLQVLGYYGLTETGGICLAHSPSQSVHGNLGFPIGTIAQVRDEAGTVVQGCGRGELAIYSPGNAEAYLNTDTQSAVRFKDGWVYTGDTVGLCEDGSFEYIGRSDDQVKNRFGELLYLQEIENAARGIPMLEDNCAIKTDHDIVLAVACAAPSDHAPWQESIFHQLTEALGESKLPDRLIRVDQIQRFGNGKTDKRAMRRRLSI